MNITYKNKKLKKLCTCEKEMQKRRPDIASRLKLRIAALESSPTLGDLMKDDPLGKWHPLRENRDGQWGGKVSSNERLIIVPRSACESMDELLACTDVMVEVIDITDYHGE